jgi:hypothetical protein
LMQHSIWSRNKHSRNETVLRRIYKPLVIIPRKRLKIYADFIFICNIKSKTKSLQTEKAWEKGKILATSRDTVTIFALILQSHGPPISNMATDMYILFRGQMFCKISKFYIRSRCLTFIYRYIYY